MKKALTILTVFAKSPSLMRNKPLPLGLEPTSIGNSSTEQQEWNTANAIEKGSITLMYSIPVQVRVFGYCDNPTKTLLEFWKVLESAYMASNYRRCAEI